MAFPIRLSPSGPVIGEVGSGFQIRLAGTDQSLTSSPVTTDLNPLVGQGTIPSVTLLNPDPAKLYSVRGHFLVNTIGNGGTSFTALIQLSYDGATWFNDLGPSDGTVSTTPRSVAPPVVDNQTSYSVYMAPILGSALVTPMVAGAAQLSARIAVSSFANNQFAIPDQGKGLFGLELIEYMA